MHRRFPLPEGNDDAARILMPSIFAFSFVLFSIYCVHYEARTFWAVGSSRSARERGTVWQRACKKTEQEVVQKNNTKKKSKVRKDSMLQPCFFSVTSTAEKHFFFSLSLFVAFASSQAATTTSIRQHHSTQLLRLSRDNGINTTSARGPFLLRGRGHNGESLSAADENTLPRRRAASLELPVLLSLSSAINKRYSTREGKIKN